MDDFTTVYVIRDQDNGRFVALFMEYAEAEDYAIDCDLVVEEHYMPNDPNAPWLVQ